MTSESDKGPAAPGHSEATSHLRFSQREGLSPVPQQLKPGEVSNELRALVWDVLYSDMKESSISEGGPHFLVDPWDDIMSCLHVLFWHKPSDEYDHHRDRQVKALKQQIWYAGYAKLFDVLEFIMSLRATPEEVTTGLTLAFKRARAAYMIVPKLRTIFPVGSEQERKTIEEAASDLGKAGFKGAEAHFAKAGQLATHGDYSGSVRESIHVVESVVTLLSPNETTVQAALTRLERSGQIHGALKSGFASIYGFTSDAEGIRHPLLEKGSANVTQEDALFMLGACAAFASYLLNRGRKANLLART